jgi:drug/metabolite transporter (DMT)-like permease
VTALLALAAAICFALAAALQQRGEFALARAGAAVQGVAGLVRLVAVPVWLLGSLISLVGYAMQGVALDSGRLVVVQPLMVTTIVWALPLGYWLTSQHVVRRQVLGAGVVVIGLAMFVVIGDPDAGVDQASALGLAISAVVISAVVVAFLFWLRTKTAPALRAAVLGLCAGLWFGLSSTFAKPVINDLHDGIAAAAGDWRTWALLGFGFAAILLQQLSLATGQLAPAIAAVSVSNPAISVVLGLLLFQERLTRPGWHVAVAFAALLAALIGAVLITLANRETPMPGQETGAHGPRTDEALA